MGILPPKIGELLHESIIVLLELSRPDDKPQIRDGIRPSSLGITFPFLFLTFGHIFRP
jgi:hypothetical protein